MNDERTEWSQDELVAECKRRFGDNPSDWAFKCPACGDIARARDFSPFAASGFGSELLGTQCVGRFVNDRGCDWAAFGLFPGPWFIIGPEGQRWPAFPLAPATEVAA